MSASGVPKLAMGLQWLTNSFKGQAAFMLSSAELQTLNAAELKEQLPGSVLVVEADTYSVGFLSKVLNMQCLSDVKGLAERLV
jgi:hypothetical protein